MINLIRSEVLKVRTTNLWWIFAMSLIVVTGLAVWLNVFQTGYLIDSPPPDLTGVDPQEASRLLAEHRARYSAPSVAAEIYTSGQYFGALLSLIIGALVVTSEFQHQTATATFLTTPARRKVVTAKLAAGALFGGLLWLITTVINLGVGVLFFHSKHLGAQLGTWEAQRAIVFNLVVFGLWAAFGIGVGSVIRNQIGATVTTVLLYTVGGSVVATVAALLNEDGKHDWLVKARVILPSEAAEIFTTPGQAFLASPPYWIGGLVLLGYGLVSAAIGMWILRARDIT